MVGYTSMVKCKALTGSAVKGLMSNISKTVTDTAMGSMEAEYETALGLSIGTMILDDFELF